MNSQTAWQMTLGFFSDLPVVVEPVGDHLTSDAGLLLFDCYDDPAHGQQQLVFFHGFYEQYQYLPRVITCAENDQTVLIQLLFGTATPELGADDDLRHLVQRLREVWPDAKIHIRGDSGFGKPLMYAVCEELRVEYSFGLGMNAILKRKSEDLLAEAVKLFEQQGQPQRLFTGFQYAAESWDHERFVIVKAEAKAQGTHRRAVVTNRPGAPHFPQAAYDEYADRGESENRNKELKRGMGGDRLSDHRFMANFFRLYLHCLALNMLVRLRRQIAAPPAQPTTEIPCEAESHHVRRTYFSRRCEHDPLGESHACTWRTRLIKVAAQIVVSTRRIYIRLSGTWRTSVTSTKLARQSSPPRLVKPDDAQLKHELHYLPELHVRGGKGALCAESQRQPSTPP